MTESHTDRAHARLAPSSAHRWLRCPGSVALSEGLEEAPSPFANEGTAAHMLADQCLQGGFNADRFKGHVVDIKGKSPAEILRYGKPDGKTIFPVDAEMVDAVQLYLDTAYTLAEESDEFEVEQRMNISDVVDGVFGTGDAIAYREQPTRRVTIVDLKYGKGVSVDVEENEQLLTYALGVLKRFHNRGVDEVELVIVQPRAPHRDGPVRRWVTDVVGLYEHAMALQDAAERVADPNAPLVPGAWCKFCKAAAICPALQDHALKIAGATKRDVLGNLTMADPSKYNAQDLAQKLKDLPLVAIWLKGVEQFGHSEAMFGRMPPGFKLVAKRATRKWKDEGEAATALQIAGVDEGDIYETKMRSPAQVETVIPKKERKAVIGELAVAQSSGTSLALVDDPRPAVDPGAALGFEAVED